MNGQYRIVSEEERDQIHAKTSDKIQSLLTAVKDKVYHLHEISDNDWYNIWSVGSMHTDEMLPIHIGESLPNLYPAAESILRKFFDALNYSLGPLLVCLSKTELSNMERNDCVARYIDAFCDTDVANNDWFENLSDREISAIVIQRGCYNWLFSPKCRDGKPGIVPKLGWSSVTQLA